MNRSLVPRLALSFALASFIGRQAGTEANRLPIISYIGHQGRDPPTSDPRSPWQRSSNENTDRLLRQYLPRSLHMLRKQYSRGQSGRAISNIVSGVISK
jgi:hypothetical protein